MERFTKRRPPSPSACSPGSTTATGITGLALMCVTLFFWLGKKNHSSIHKIISRNSFNVCFEEKIIVHSL